MTAVRLFGPWVLDELGPQGLVLLLDEHSKVIAEERLRLIDDLSVAGGLTLGLTHKNVKPPGPKDPKPDLTPLMEHREALERIRDGLPPVRREAGKKRVLAEADDLEIKRILERRAQQTMQALDALDA